MAAPNPYGRSWECGQQGHQGSAERSSEQRYPDEWGTGTRNKKEKDHHQRREVVRVLWT